MSTRNTLLSSLVSALLCLAGASGAAKTLIVLNPWATDPVRMNTVPQVFGAYTNWASGVTPTAQLTKTTGDWWSYTFNINAPGDFRLLNLTNWQEYGTGGVGTTASINLNTQFGTSDTLWMVPTPLPSGAPQILTRSPSKIVLMLQSPWEAATPGVAPSLQLETNAWKAFSPVAGPGGWYSATADMFSHLTVGIRNAAGTSYLGATGVSGTTTTMTLDSMLTKNDTVWIVPSTGKTLILPAPPSTRKIVAMLLNPWETSQPGLAPSMQVESKPWKATVPVVGSPGWYSAVLDSFSILQLGIRNATSNSFLGATGISATATTMLLDSTLVKNDTVWIVPTVSNPLILSTQPVARPMVVMLLNPWAATQPGKFPSIRVETNPWKNFAAVTGTVGWVSASTTFYGNLSVTIRNADSSAYLGPNGSAASATTLLLDTAAAKNDTVWIAPFAGVSQILSTPPRTRTVLVFNPWDGVFPLERPVAFVDGSAVGTAMAISDKFCGWFVLTVPYSPARIALASSGRATAYGASGVGSTTPIDLTAIGSDSIWIDTRAAFPVVQSTNPGASGLCSSMLLATTVHDFAANHPDFGHASSGVVGGMVERGLDIDSKPVKWNDSAWNASLSNWFRDVSGTNASACRDLVLELDTATGNFARKDTAYFPVDDFVTLPGGGANPFNELVGSTTKVHDHAFCTESHGEFLSAPGQKLTFGGTDDRWFYLDGVLRMDLGGVHADSVLSIALDTMGLTAGSWHRWDLFACQRTDSASRLTVSTNMKPTTVARYLVTDSVASAGVHVVRIQTTSAIGQGCNAVVTKTPAKGAVSIRGPGLPSTLLSTGTSFGGIEVGDSSWQVKVDSSKFKGLQPGRYILKLASFGDSTVWREFAFQVPNRGYSIKPGARCDLMSSVMRDTSGCLDISRLDGVTLQVPSAVTRLATDGLVLCGKTTSSTPGTDIVYVVDQSGSMYSSDPTGSRAQVVKDAILQQASLSPSGYATWVPFDYVYSAPPMIPVSDVAQRTALFSQITAVDGGGTAYMGPLGWARALLQGATQVSSPTTTMPPSPSRRKAIIMISDGEPGDDLTTIMTALVPSASVSSPTGYSWTLPNDSSPPVYGFFIGQNAPSTNTLRKIADTTHGAFFSIPVGRPDSLQIAMKAVLGAILSKSVPDTLFVYNRANGQKSVGLSAKQEGAGWRFQLDSLVALVPGRNELELRSIVKTNNHDSTVLAKWTVVVSDSGLNLSAGGGDSTLDASCFEPTKLKIRPATDSARHYADSRDVALRISLDARYDRQLSFPLTFSTVKSLDSGLKVMVLADTPTTVRAKVDGTNAWTLPPVVTTDTVIQTRYGWDTVHVVFHTPRDWRDSAVAVLPVYHPWPVSVRLSPDTGDGFAGNFKLAVSDSNVVLDTVRAVVVHKRGDTVKILLHRDRSGDFVGTIPYRQNSPITKGDSLIQTGPVRQIPLDSVYAAYLGARDTAILRRPPPVLRFVGSDGKPVDSLPLARLDLDQTDSVTVGSFVDTMLVPRSDSVVVSRPSWLDLRGPTGIVDGARLAAGLAKVVVGGNRPGTGGRVVFRMAGSSDSLVRTIDVLGYRLRFVDGSGAVVDSAKIDRDLFSDTLVHVEIWGQKARCTACHGWVRDSASSSRTTISDSAGAAIDSFEIVGGRGRMRLNGVGVDSNGQILLRSAGLWASAVVAPVSWRPYRLRFVDGSGVVVDSAKIDRDLFSDTLLRVQVWGRNGLCAKCDGSFFASTNASQISLTDSSGAKRDSFRLAAGVGQLRIVGRSPVTDSVIKISAPVFGASASLLSTWRPYRLRFVDGSGAVVDSAKIDRDLFSDTLLRVQIWGRDGLCTKCDGSFFASTSASQIALSDSTGAKQDSFRLAAGVGQLRIVGRSSVTDSVIKLSSPVFGASASLLSTWRPYRLRFVDGSGAAVDSAKIDRDLFSDTLLRVQVWGRNGLCTRCDGSFLASSSASQMTLRDSSGAVVDSFRLKAGVGQLTVHSLRPVAAAKLELKSPLFEAQSVVDPVTFHAYRIRFAKAGGISDSFASDTTLRKNVGVGIEIWGIHGRVPVAGHLLVHASRSDLRTSDSAGHLDSLFEIRDGAAFFRARSDVPVDSGVLKLSVDSLWAKSVAAPLVWRQVAPDSAAYFDADGDGSLDRVVAWFALPWNPSSLVRFPWPDSTKILDLSKAKRSLSDDSLVVTWAFDAAQSPKTTTWTGIVPKARFQWDSTRKVLAFSAIERIAPIPLRARIRRGGSVDTLVVKISEGIDSSRLNGGRSTIRRVWPDSVGVPAGAISWNGQTGELRLMIGRDSIDRFVRPGDSIRLPEGGPIFDLGANAPGRNAAKVEVEGVERSPVSAIVSDRNADGRADHVTLRFANIPRTVDSYRFRWPDRDGRLQDRELAVSKAVSDSSGRILTFAVDPWGFGATSCPDSGCVRFGRLRTTRWGDTLDKEFDLVDGVVPVILKAQLRFGNPLGTLDTVRATLSESVKAADRGAWLTWGRPGRDSLGDTIARLQARRIGDTVLELLVDSTFPATAKDSLRLAFGGGVSDSVGNAPGKFAHWTPFELGMIPLRLNASAWPSMVNYTGWRVPDREPSLSIFVRATYKDEWKDFDGRGPQQDLSHYVGIVLKANSEIDGGALHLFDNLGVAVAHIDLAVLFDAAKKDQIARDLRGGYQVWIAWDGRTQAGEMASSGVYPARLMVWKRRDGQVSMVNNVFKLGWRMPTVDSWDNQNMPNW